MRSISEIQQVFSRSERSSWIPKSWRVRLIALAAPVACVLLYIVSTGTSGDVRFVTVKVTRGAVIRAVTATGTLNPEISVPVGSYVSGPIIALYADFNSPVKQGQPIARIDPRPFELKVAQARALVETSESALAKDEADMRYKKLLYERNRGLLELGAASKDTVDNNLSTLQQAAAQVALDRAQIKQQRAALQDTEVNLNYTNIVSPVDGTVVSRNVDVGQTVAASFQTPTLFLIARDLTQMQVDCSVSESDIGGIREGQIASFKVDAFPDREMQGTIAQVRQAPITVQNVVTYDVVVKVPNPELLLKPGMTANVTIVTSRRDDVLRVPVQALRFVPRHRATGDFAADPSGRIARQARIWVSHGRIITPVVVTTGLSDDNFVEILGGDLHPGENLVINELMVSTHAPQSGARNLSRMQ